MLKVHAEFDAALKHLTLALIDATTPASFSKLESKCSSPFIHAIIRKTPSRHPAHRDSVIACSLSFDELDRLFGVHVSEITLSRVTV